MRDQPLPERLSLGLTGAVLLEVCCVLLLSLMSGVAFRPLLRSAASGTLEEPNA
ncbi:Uncharacterised protein [Mycobacteroides abscessus]|nr:Uncharacterised protein [Mycobacteroides abscessus]